MTDDTDTEEKETERARVQCYLPAYQKDIWDADAEAMDMSLSEFVRCMVQAGRRGFDATAVAGQRGDDPSQAFGKDAVRERVVAMLEEVDPLTFDELHLLLSGDIEGTLDGALQALGSDGEVVHLRDGYQLAGDRGGDE